MILHEKTKEEFGYEFETSGVWKEFYCQCDYCGDEFMRSKRNIKVGRKILEKESCNSKDCAKKKREESQLLKYGVKNAGGTVESKIKAQKTFIDRYGVENPMFLEEFKEKVKETSNRKYGTSSYLATDKCKKESKLVSLAKYGCENFSQAEEIKEKTKQTNLKKYGVEYPSQSEVFKEKVKSTCLEKYGVDNYAKTEECLAKVKATMLGKYEVEYALQNPLFLEKFKETCIERYGEDNYSKTKEFRMRLVDIFIDKFGFEHPMKSNDIKEKVKQTCLDKYGFDSYSKTEEFKERYAKTCLDKYGFDNLFKNENIKEKSKQTCLDKYNFDSYSKTEEFKKRYTKTCLDKYGVHNTLLLITNSVYGKTQDEINNWLDSFGNKFNKDRKILEGKEIDLYNDNLKLGIEYCGLYWHTEISKQPRGKNYHYDKYKLCKEKGVHLITIFEDEWLNKEDICKSILKSKLGYFDNKIGARKCNIAEVSKDKVKKFLEDNHLQGNNNFIKYSCGLFYNDDLIGVMCMGSHHRKNKCKEEIVLIRLCFKKNWNIQGGASKLFKNCKAWACKNGYKSIVTWSDNRWSNGSVYNKLKFNLDESLKPDYSYVDLKNVSRHSKQSKKKSNTNCPKDCTERDWMIYNGFARIWDCGKIRWKFNLS